MTDQQQDPRRAARSQQRQMARAEGAAEVEAMTLQVDRALGAIRSDTFWTDIIAAVPKSMDKQSFRDVAMTAIIADPKLLTADRKSLMLELMFCARMGLMPGGYGEIALFADAAGKVQHRVEYGGILKLAHNTGMVASADAVAVYDGERCELSPTEKPLHKYSLRGRGEWLGSYAYVERTNGRWQVEWMTADEIRDHAKRYSEALRQNRQTPWKDPEAEVEMGNKTVLRRLLKYVPKSAEVAAVLAHEDALDRAMYARDVTGTAPALPALAAPTPHGWGRQFDAGNGHEGVAQAMDRVAAQAEDQAFNAPQSRSEPPQRATAPSHAEAPAGPASPPERSQARTEGPKKRGRPSKAELAERTAREIIAEINATAPADVQVLMDTHAQDLNDLPDELRTEVVTAAQDRMEQGASDDGPAGEEPPPADEHGEPVQESRPAIDENEYREWYKGRRSYVMHLPAIAHLMKYRPEEVEAARERYGDDAAEQISALFDEAEARMRGGGR